ncbi:MAG: LamG domain-containing protein, partial [Planctomycetes bacterium]|nr:LamG domain-containing protein [Planctomycetota bacterium]
VAATYHGTPGTTPMGGKFYWTRIEPGVLAANQIGEFALAQNLSDTVPGITAVSVHRRGGYRDPLHGLVDEVRISSIARAADDMFLPAEFPPTYQASNPSPAHGTERVSPNTVLRWMAPTFTDSPTYAVRLGTDPNTLNNPVIEAGLVEPALDVNGLLDEGTTYFWSVDASNGETYGSDDWSFTTYAIPDNLSGPYALDADTLHLWHLERQLENPPELDPDDWYLDSAFPDSNDPTVWTDLITPHGDRRDSLPGFGYAFHTYTHLGSPSGVTSKYVEPQSEFQSEDGAFTYEAIIKADDLVGAYGTQRLIDRGSAFQLSINNGDLLFVPSGITDPNMQGRAEIPTESVHAFQSDRWYHVAVTFDGVSQGALYWTEMLSGVNQANQIGEFTMEPLAGDISSATSLASPGDDGGSYLVGLIDEVRVSRIAREPDDFFFSAGQ